MSLARVRFQPAAVRTLRAAVAGDRVAHAYVFVGPRGVGKGLAARELAKLLFCNSPRGRQADSIDPCDACDHCRRVDRDVHPDLYWFRKEPDHNDFRINLVVRGRGEDEGAVAITVTESVVFTPMEARRTVTVIDDAELLNAKAANALLKTLEEPSPHAVLVLLCADASQLPGTVLSRCQWVRFGPLPEEFVAEKVREALPSEVPMGRRRAESTLRSRLTAKEGRTLSPEEIAFICRFAGGSIEQALRLAESGLWDLKRQLVARLPDMDAAAAIEMAEAVDRWARAVAKEVPVKWESPEGNAVRRTSARLALAAVASAFGDAAALAAGAGGAARLVNADQRQVIENLAAWSADVCSQAVGLLADGQDQIGRYVHTELATENALIQVSRLRPGRA